MKTVEKINNILIIKPGAIGDVLQLTPVIRALKEKYPRAAISLLVGSRTTAELFKHNTSVHDTVVFDKKGEHRSFPSLVKLWRLLHENRYDLIINFQRSNWKAWFLASSAIPCRILVYHKARTRNIHAVENHLETLSPLGITGGNMDLELHTGEEDKAFAANIIRPFGPSKKAIVVLNPGASHRVNRWGTDRFARLADMLVQQLSANVIVIGGQEDVTLAQEIGAKASSKPLIIAGKTTLLQLGALLQQSDILVTGDTGPMHVAAAAGTRVVALFGAADPKRTGPIGSGHKIIQAAGVSCIPCRSRSCSNRFYLECMEKISVDTVFKTISEMVTQNRC